MTADYHDSTSCSNFYWFVCVFVYYLFRTIRNFYQTYTYVCVSQSFSIYELYVFLCLMKKGHCLHGSLTLFNGTFLLNVNQFERLIIRLNVLIWYYLCSTAIFFPCNHFTAGGIVIMLCSIKKRSSLVDVILYVSALACTLGSCPLDWAEYDGECLYFGHDRRDYLGSQVLIDWLIDWLIDRWLDRWHDWIVGHIVFRSE